MINLNCSQCQQQFSSKRRSAKYCSNICKSRKLDAVRKIKASASRLKRQLKKSILFDKSSFAKYLIQEVKRAGTLQILEGHTGATFLQLLQLTRDRTNYNGIKDGKANAYFELSHIVAVADKTRLGLLHPLNLVLAPVAFNRKRGTKPAALGAGLSISRRGLDRSLFIDQKNSPETLLKRIKAYLGVDVMNEFYQKAKLYLTQRNALLTKLSKYACIEDFSNHSNDELALALTLHGVKANILFSKPSKSEFDLAKNEMSRFKMEDSVLYWIIEWHLSQDEFCVELGPTSRLTVSEPTVFLSNVLTQIWLQLHGDQFYLGFEGKHLIQHFEIDADKRPTSWKLDQSVFAWQEFKDQFNKIHPSFHHDTESIS